MALASSTVWEIRTTGSDTNGGGFNSAGSGTDYSQQDAAQVTYTDLVIDAATNTKLTSVATPFTAAHVGNIINITSGTGFTVQRVMISSVTAGVATCDKSCGTLSSTGGNGKLGGALASPGLVGSVAVAGNIIHLKAGTYSITSASTNVSGGCPSFAAGSSTLNILMTGYQTTRGDNGTKPLLQASGISTFTILAAAACTVISNIEFDGASLTSSRAVNLSANALVIRCLGRNCTNSAFAATTTNGRYEFCEATGCSTQPAFFCSTAAYCVAHDNTITGFDIGTSAGVFIGCLSVNNTGASSYGFQTAGVGHTLMVDCTAYANGSHGFYSSAVPTGIISLINCLASGNTGYGFSANSATPGFYLKNCATYNNTGGSYDATKLTAANVTGMITPSGDPFTNAAGNDFSLNNTASQGASLRAAGLPGASGFYVLPGISTLNYSDVGAAQHADPVGGGSGGLRAINLNGGIRG